MGDIENPNFRCPLCLNAFECAVMTSCGHSFCGQCIIDYWKSRDMDQRVECPIDRSLVTLLIPNYSLRDEISRIRGSSTKPQVNESELKSSIATYNRRFSKDGTIREQLRDQVSIAQFAMSESRLETRIFLSFFFFVFACSFIPEEYVEAYPMLLDNIDYIIYIVIVVVLFRIIKNARRSLMG